MLELMQLDESDMSLQAQLMPRGAFGCDLDTPLPTCDLDVKTERFRRWSAERDSMAGALAATAGETFWRLHGSIGYGA